EIGPGRWIHDGSVTVYFDLDIAFYGLAIPLLTFAILSLLNQWLERKEHAEREARASEQRLAAIMTASAYAIVGIDAAGRTEDWNHGAELLFGRKATQICGQQFAVLFGSGEAAAVEWQWLKRTAQQTGFIRGHETTCRDANGNEISVELTATRLLAEQGRSGG